MVRSIRPFGPILALAPAALAVLLVAQPALAEVVLKESGNYGPYEVYDQSAPRRGANCIYETGSHDLDSISVRGPHNVHSSNNLPTSQLQKVGWRYVIQRQVPRVVGPWSDYFKSSWVYEMVDGNTNPGQFARRSWIAPENPTGHYRVLIIIKWVKPSTATQTWGTARIRYEWYKAKWKGNSYVNPDTCLPDY